MQFPSNTPAGRAYLVKLCFWSAAKNWTVNYCFKAALEFSYSHMDPLLHPMVKHMLADLLGKLNDAFGVRRTQVSNSRSFVQQTIVLLDLPQLFTDFYPATLCR